MKRQRNNKDWILAYTKKKYICQCVVCGEIGMRENCPEKFFNKFFVEKEFKILRLDDNGICEECQKIIKEAFENKI
jgi:hypothetical protein